MSRLDFFMPMIPPTVTAQEHKIHVVKGRPIVYDTEQIKAARQKLEAHLSKHVPAERFAGPLRLIAKWCFPIGTKNHNGQWKATRPDTDNLQKLLKDSMTRVGFWNDDAQVASEITEKFWADTPGIYIAVEELT